MSFELYSISAEIAVYCSWSAAVLMCCAEVTVVFWLACLWWQTLYRQGQADLNSRATGGDCMQHSAVWMGWYDRHGRHESQPSQALNTVASLHTHKHGRCGDKSSITQLMCDSLITLYKGRVLFTFKLRTLFNNILTTLLPNHHITFAMKYLS